MLPSEVLDAAAELIEPEGKWCQFAFECGDARCALGAISDVGDKDATAGIEACCWMGKVIPCITIGEWNDVRGRTQAEVVAKLREAAEIARREGR